MTINGDIWERHLDPPDDEPFDDRCPICGEELIHEHDDIYSCDDCEMTFYYDSFKDKMRRYDATALG